MIVEMTASPSSLDRKGLRKGTFNGRGYFLGISINDGQTFDTAQDPIVTVLAQVSR
jgi:hypothetical protein